VTVSLQTQCREFGHSSERCLNPFCDNPMEPKRKHAAVKFYCSAKCAETVSILRRAAVKLLPLGKERAWEILTFIL